MGFFGGSKPYWTSRFRAEHDGAALVEVETVGQHGVMAKRQKTMVQSLGDLVKSSAADVMMVGR